MALNTQNDIITEVLTRNNRTTTDGFITDSNLRAWFGNAHTYTAAFKKWPMTLGRVQTTWASVEEWSFEGYKAESIRIVTVGGNALTKLNFEDYLKYRENNPNGTDRVYTAQARNLFINPNHGLSGTLVAWGQYQPTLDVSDYTSKTVFSDYDEEGNEAIVEKMSEYLKRKEHATEEADNHLAKTDAILEKVWKRVLDEAFKAKTHPTTGGMFARFDILQGGFHDELFNRDQF